MWEAVPSTPELGGAEGNLGITVSELDYLSQMRKRARKSSATCPDCLVPRSGGETGTRPAHSRPCPPSLTPQPTLGGGQPASQFLTGSEARRDKGKATWALEGKTRRNLFLRNNRNINNLEPKAMCLDQSFLQLYVLGRPLAPSHSSHVYGFHSHIT